MDFSTFLLFILGIGLGIGLPIYLYFLYIKKSNKKHKEWLKQHESKISQVKHSLTQEEIDKKREEDEIQRITEREKNRKNKEEYMIKKFIGWPQTMFLFAFFIVFIFGIVTLISEWDRESWYYQYKILFWVFVGVSTLFGITSEMVADWKKVYELKPEEQKEKYNYDMEYIYTDSQFVFIILSVSKIIYRLVSLTVVIIGGYLLLSWIGDKIEEMELKSIVIIGMIIVISLLIGIYNNVKNKQ